MSTITNAPMGMVERLKAAASVAMTGRVPNPLAQEPKNRSRASLVKELTIWCRETREFWKPIFDRIEEEQEFAAGLQWPHEYECKGGEDEPYVGDVMQQMLNRKTASLYAKNPTPEAKLVERMNFAVWDESNESLAGARAILEAAQPILQAAQTALDSGMEVPAPPPQLQHAIDIVTDYEQGQAEKALKAKVARTYTLLLAQQWRSQSPEFLASMKQLVTRVLTSRVGYIKAMYRRGGDDQSGNTPTEQANVPLDKIALLKQHLEQMSQPDYDLECSEAEEARLIMQELLQGPSAATQMADGNEDEGLVYDFLSATSVLVDPKCTCLREFVGAKRIAHEICLPVEEAEKEFGVNLRDAGAMCYTEAGKESTDNGELTTQDDGDRGNVCIWEIQDKETGLVYVVCDGVKDFLREPAEPEPAVARFWSIVPVVFNVQEVRKNQPKRDVTIYPRSDVRLAMPMQQNINQAGEGMRQHRVAGKPWWVGVKSKFDDGDLKKLSAPREAHDCVMMNNLNAGEKITDFIQPGPRPDFHPELYDTGMDNQAMMLATGMQPANLGAQVADEKATGQAIAEGSRISADASNAHDLDTALSTLAQMSFEMLTVMPAELVKKRVGRGAVVPELTAQEIREDMFLQVEAGSSGRPNQAQEINNFKILGPILQELLTSSGKSLEPLIKDAVRRLNDKADVDDYMKPAQVGGQMMPAPAQPVPMGSGGAPINPGNVAAQVAPGVNGAPPVPLGASGAPPLPAASRNLAQRTAAA